MDHSASSTRRDRQGSKSQAGSTLRRASQASLANGSRRPGWLHAPACEDSKPGNNFSTQHGAGRVEKRGERQQENLESQAGSTPQRANQGTLPQSYCQSRGSMLRRANTASPAATSQHNTALAGLKDDKFLNAAGSTLWRANTASPAIVFKKNGPFSQQHKKRQTRIQKPGWLHAPACEPSQLGKWIQKAGMAARSGVRRQQARQQLLNTTRRWQG